MTRNAWQLLAWIGWSCVALLSLVSHARACDRVIALRQAEFRLVAYDGDPPRPPVATRPTEASASRVALPDRLGRRLDGARGMAWYRVRLPEITGDEVCGVLIETANPNAVVYLNGRWLGQSGRFAEPHAHTWNHPLYFSFAPAWLDQTQNWIDVGVQANGGVYNAMDAIVIGPDATLLPRYKRLWLLRVGISQASTLLSLGVVVLFAAFGFSLRAPTYLLLSAAAACYGISSLNYHWREPPFEGWFYNTVMNVAVDWTACTLVLLILRLLELRWRNVERAVLAFGGAVALAAMLLSGPVFERRVLFAHVPAAAICLAALCLIFVHRARLPPIERVIYLVTSSLMVAIALHDIWVQVSKKVGPIDVNVLHWFPALGPAMLIGFGSALLARFVRVYERAERANVELQSEVAKKHAELEANFVRMREFENHHLLTEERERIMREMHDGLGGHLVSALSMIESGASQQADLARALREALDDMRVVIHSLQPSACDIAGLLADMRARVEPQLAGEGLRFRWAVQDLPTQLQLSPSQVLDVLRIVQESITNVRKHAGARYVRISTGTTEAVGACHAYVEIADDGRGIAAQVNTGRGLLNMHERARRLGASLSIASDAGGTSVRLAIPVPDAR